MVNQMQKYKNPLLQGVFYRLVMVFTFLMALWAGIFWAM